MIAAHRAGIPVFVTGGIGGVHKDGENSKKTGEPESWVLGFKNPVFFPVALDVSSDLTELGRTPIAVVSAGVKSILDIGRTLEFLVRTLSSSPSPFLTNPNC